MHFGTKNILKNNRNHTPKYLLQKLSQTPPFIKINKTHYF
jgi:hypothetical protein